MNLRISKYNRGKAIFFILYFILFSTNLSEKLFQCKQTDHFFKNRYLKTYYVFLFLFDSLRNEHCQCYLFVI